MWCRRPACAPSGRSAATGGATVVPGSSASCGTPPTPGCAVTGRRGQSLSFDEELHARPCEDQNPEQIVLRELDAHRLRQAMEALPTEFREVMVLRETGRAVLQRDRRHRRRPAGDGDVAPGACPQAARAVFGGRACGGNRTWIVRRCRRCCTPI